MQQDAPASLAVLIHVASTVRTDASGSCTLTGLSGLTYSVRASFYASHENNGSADTTVSVVDEAVTGVRLVLEKLTLLAETPRS